MEIDHLLNPYMRPYLVLENMIITNIFVSLINIFTSIYNLFYDFIEFIIDIDPKIEQIIIIALLFLFLVEIIFNIKYNNLYN